MYETDPLLKRTPEARGLLLETFADNPHDDEIWQIAYNWARQEEGSTPEISADELITFAEQVRATKPADRYALTTGHASDGQLWFDVLSTFSSPQIERAKLTYLDDIVAASGFGFERALDVGTGTGKSLHALESVAMDVVGLDRNPHLLAAATERKADATNLVQAEVMALPFAAESFDLAASSGIGCALDAKTTVRFYSELARVLIPGGMYVDVSYHTNENGYAGPEMTAIQASSKAMLADMIVDTTSGKLEVTDSLDPVRFQLLLGKLGLQLDAYGIEDSEAHDGTESLVLVFTKQT